MTRDDRVVDFPVPPEERARRLRAEFERLARQSPAEWLFWLNDSAKKHGIERELRVMVEATIKANEKKAREDKAENQRREQRAEKQRASARREEERQQRAQEKADKDAERKQREREKEFAAIAKLPSAQHEPRLAALAKRLDENLDVLRDEFAEFTAVEDKGSGIEIEPWPEPVDARALLTELTTQVRRYVVIHDDAAAVAVVLWICFAWVHEIAVHSPLLLLIGADSDTGKTTACSVLRYSTPRAYAAAELTGPSMYRFVDRVCPTLIIDDADQLLERKPDLRHIINIGWTRGTKIPRQDRHGNTLWFDPFCPKVIAGINPSLPKATMTRTIKVRLLPKLLHEKVDPFRHVDDDAFMTLRRKLARFAADNAAALKEAHPVLPAGFSNRLAMNWELLFAIEGQMKSVG